MTRILALCLLLLVALPVPSHAAVLWFSGVEAAGFGAGFPVEFSGPNCASFPTASNSAGYTGAYGLNAVVGRCISQQTPSHPLTLFVRLRFRLHGISGGPPGSSVTIVCPGQQSLGAACLDIQINTSRKVIFGAFGTGSTTIADNTWYLLKMKGVVDASVGGAEVTICNGDGTNCNLEFSNFAIDTSSFVSFGYVSFGPFELFAGIVSMDYDDMMICDTAYCPAGGTIARQGTAGTPTYNAWTKTNCTTADECWSETPFSATKNANSATATDAQTMFVHDFATTQTGHGTETIAPHDTINACKTGAIIKSGTSSAPLSLRRRLNGTDTDTAQTLSTSDAYYDDGIWTTTTGILRDSAKMEIGALHGAGVATDTVEDMWLLCDYSAVTTPIRHRTILR